MLGLLAATACVGGGDGDGNGLPNPNLQEEQFTYTFAVAATPNATTFRRGQPVGAKTTMDIIEHVMERGPVSVGFDMKSLETDPINNPASTIHRFYGVHATPYTKDIGVAMSDGEFAYSRLIVEMQSRDVFCIFASGSPCNLAFTGTSTNRYVLED